uniref:RHS repeat-associated core domain-containing protein n=1 Tax=Pseudomonas sp. UMAB-08 TaxID=1365375 RepID=UPI00214B5855
NGEPPDPVTGHYLLGNGYRAFNPVLMRFNSPDSLSPFGEGGLNGYAYCGGDPVNYRDPTGHIPAFMKPALRFFKVIKPHASTRAPRAASLISGSNPLNTSTFASADAPRPHSAPLTSSPINKPTTRLTASDIEYENLVITKNELRKNMISRNQFLGRGKNVPLELQEAIHRDNNIVVNAIHNMHQPPSYAYVRAYATAKAKAEAKAKANKLPTYNEVMGVRNPQ